MASLIHSKRNYSVLESLNLNEREREKESSPTLTFLFEYAHFYLSVTLRLFILSKLYILLIFERLLSVKVLKKRARL